MFLTEDKNQKHGTEAPAEVSSSLALISCLIRLGSVPVTPVTSICAAARA